MKNLRLFFDDYANSHNTTISAMERKAGVSVGVIVKMSPRTGFENIAKIVAEYPDIDVYDLMEIPNPLCEKVSENASPIIEEPSDIEWYKDQIERKDKIIDQLLTIIQKGEGKDISQSINL